MVAREDGGVHFNGSQLSAHFVVTPGAVLIWRGAGEAEPTSPTSSKYLYL